MIRRTRSFLLAALAWPLSSCALDMSHRSMAPPDPIARVALRAPTSPMRVGQTAQLGVALLTTAGDSVTGRISWAVSDTAIATVTPGGRFIAGTKPGTAVITATSEGLSGSAVVTVTAPAWRLPWKEGAVVIFCRIIPCYRIVAVAANQMRSQYDAYKWRNRRRIGFLLGALAAVALGLSAARRRTERQLAPA